MICCFTGPYCYYTSLSAKNTVPASTSQSSWSMTRASRTVMMDFAAFRRVRPWMSSHVLGFEMVKPMLFAKEYFTMFAVAPVSRVSTTVVDLWNIVSVEDCMIPTRQIWVLATFCDGSSSSFSRSCSSYSASSSSTSSSLSCSSWATLRECEEVSGFI
jgi:hypothetical protein